MSAAQLAELAAQTVLVVGDVVLDEYLFGRATRLLREAPIPVLEFERRLALPGGAANPAHNIAALGATALLGGVVGDDAEGAQLRELLGSVGVASRGVLTDPSRPTTVKTRILAEGLLRYPQQLARLDRLSRAPVEAAIVAELEALIRAEAPAVNAVLCSDYLSGLLTPALVDHIKALCQAQGLLLTVDAQGDIAKYRGADVVRCNSDEAQQHLGRLLRSDADYEAGLTAMQQELAVKLLVVTRGSAGVSLVGAELDYTHLAGRPVEVADTTGAGDTFIALLTVALAAGWPALAAARLANVAAGAVVRRFGNAVLSLAELQAELSSAHAEER